VQVGVLEEQSAYSSHNKAAISLPSPETNPYEYCTLFTIKLNDVVVQKLKSLVAECEALAVKASYYCADATDDEAMDNAVNECLITFSSVNILVNNGTLQ